MSQGHHHKSTSWLLTHFEVVIDIYPDHVYELANAETASGAEVEGSPYIMCPDDESGRPGSLRLF